MTFRMIAQLRNTNTPAIVSCDADLTENYMYISMKIRTGVHVFCWEVVFNRSCFQSVSCNVNMVVAILILIYMTSILLTFSVPIHQFSTFLLREGNISSQHSFSFHDAKSISYVLFCTALVVGPSIRIFPLA